MKNIVWAAVISAMLSSLQLAVAFELSTHAALTEQSFGRFLREHPTILTELGFPASLVDPEFSQPIGSQYFEMLVLPDNTPPRRLFDAFERDVIARVNRSMSPRSITGWTMAGAIREDDILWKNPQDANPNIMRIFNHFYDPVFQRPLSPCPVTTCDLAPNWATGSPDAFDQPNRIGEGQRNHFTTIVAKEALFRALTLKTRFGNSWIDIPQPADAKGKESLRNEYWATMFRTLGDVLHLVQDMAQPQHTRNDTHAGAPLPYAGHQSVFENYLDARARRQAFFEISPYGVWTTTLSIANRPLPFQICDGAGNICADYPTPTVFTEYSQFFSTAPGSAIGGNGLADYSNTQFFTAGKNLGNANYASPPNTLSAYTLTSVAPTHWDGTPISGSDGAYRVYLFSRGIVLDNLNLAYNAFNVPLTSMSIWDEFMLGRALSPSFHLIRENYDAQAALLLPRAVAYSAGMLQHFFRGRIQIDLPNDGVYAVLDNAAPICKDTCGYSKIKLKITNQTTAESLLAGTFFAVVKFHRNDCYRPDLSGDPGGPNFPCGGGRTAAEEIVVSDPVDLSAILQSGTLAPNAQAAISFAFSTPIPINATDIYLQVVFRGQLGNETDAVVVTTKNISEPNYVAFVNDFDYHYNATLDTFQSVAPDPLTQTITQIDVKLGNATTPVATLVNLGARKYAQLAFLTDLGTSGTEKLVIDYSAPGFGSPFTYDLPISTFDSPGGAVYQRLPRNISSYRGMWSDYRLDFFQGGGYSIAACPAQDTRRICTSAGLTSIPPANAVAWTINFP